MGDSKKALAELEQKEFPQVGQVTCSIGFAAVDPAQPPANILDNADQALYYAKGNGR
ncbi:TPA: diguanylate cyclase, partial [Escherichia coli]|nr:diguanylate cyclase [Salmonella enterica]HAD3173352.1 diguanylate cyclase [Salmonella enterica subsp. enterica serovar Typhimurium]HAD3572905.1 diguanylate cyclase [Salmonella enterica subsp. enterica serovar Typhimurium]HCB4455081.1 diguanylate cyclase [Salmonella enterica]HCN0200508.1 diguanylate cyclase [Escherichia coli]